MPLLRESDLHRRPPAYETGNLTTDISRIHEVPQYLCNSGSGIAAPQPIGLHPWIVRITTVNKV